MRIVTLRNAAAPVVAVNDVVIANAEIAREAQNHAGASAKEAWEAAARALIVRELLAQRARALGLVPDPQSVDGLRETGEEALIRALLETELRTPKADEAACRRYYAANPARFQSPALFEPRHILFQAAREDTAAYAVALERARAVLAEVLAAPERFDALARAHSACASAAEGGRLGQIRRGETTPEFEAALLALAAGETCREPVQTRYGVHVLRLDRKAPGQLLPFAAMRGRIARYLEESAWHRAVAQYVALLAGQASIMGFDMPGAPTPLVQ